MNRIVVRPRVQTPLLVVGFAVWALVGATYFADGQVVSGSDWFGLALACFLLISGAAGIWRAGRLGIVIDTEGLRVRNFDSRDQVISWKEVEVIDRQQISVRAGIPLLAPVLHIRGEGVYVIRAFGTYSRTGVDRRVEQLRDFQIAAQIRGG